MSDNEKKEPVGKRIRALIEPALDDPRRPQIQLQALDEIFNKVAGIMPRALEGEFNNFSRHVENESARKPENRNPTIIEALTRMGSDGESGYSPIKKFGLPISTTFTNFSASDIKELPGYIKLHETAREMDVAVKLLGVVADEAKASSYGLPAILVVDGSKSYQDGAMENANLYPDLPPRKTDFGRRGGDFNL